MLDTGGFEKKAGELDKIKVSDAMRKEVTCISEDTPFPEAVRLMITKKIRRIPVVKDGKLIGIIARSDIVEVIIKQYGIIE
jgi:CBS domain-containing protein